MHMVLVSGSAHEPDEHGDEGGDWERKWGGVEAPRTAKTASTTRKLMVLCKEVHCK